MMMYTVQYFDEATQDDATLFTGTLEECQSYIQEAYEEAEDEFETEAVDELFIVEPDGFTVVE